MDTFTTLEAVLLQLREELRAGRSIDAWEERCLYAVRALCAGGRYQLSDRCLIAADTVVGEDEIEVLPPEAEALGLGLYCYGRDLADVVSAAVEQLPNAGAQELLLALNYHSVNDSFLNFSQWKRRPKRWNIGIFPRFPAPRLRQELEDRGSDVLAEGFLLEYPAGSVLAESGDSEIVSLCNLISFHSEFALYLCVTLPSAKGEGRWTHMLYQGNIVSPIAVPEDRKQRGQPRLTGNGEAFAQAFPGADPALLEQYLQSDFEIAESRRRWAAYMERRHRQKGWRAPEPPPVRRIRGEDRYASDDYRQVFDLLRCLGFPLEADLPAL